MLEEIKNLRPCRCGGVPEVNSKRDIDSLWTEYEIRCPKCGKEVKTDNKSLLWLVNRWNDDDDDTVVEYWRKTNPVQYGMFYNYGRTRIDPFEIERVIFNNPATIVFWKDGEKTVVKAIDEPFDEEKGLAMAIAKKAYGNQGNYFNKLKKWLPEIKESCGECEYCDNTDCQNTPTE